MRTTIPLVLLLACLGQSVTAQKKIVLETVRCRSVQGATMNYLLDVNTRRIFAAQLNTLLVKYQHLPLSDTLQLPIEDLNENSVRNNTRRNLPGRDTSDLSLYISLLENTPARFYAGQAKTAEDSLKIKSIRTVFQLHVLLQTNSGNKVLDDFLTILVQASSTPGMGVESPVASVLGKGFTEILKAGMNILLDPANDLSQIEVQAAPAYAADNYILPLTAKLPRIYVTAVKGISSYQYNSNNEMIRQGDPIYEEIRLKGKKAEKYADDLTKAIKGTDDFAGSDFVFLRQECRDVLHDRNYLLKLVTQVNPNGAFFDPDYIFTNFLAGSFHHLLNEKDTVAVFSIEKSKIDYEKKIYANRVSNGFDTASIYPLVAQETIWPVEYNYLITGKIAKQDFSIKCSGMRNKLKEIYLNNQLVCIAQGKFSPERFVVFDASLSPELLNQLFMIGFNRFFE